MAAVAAAHLEYCGAWQHHYGYIIDEDFDFLGRLGRCLSQYGAGAHGSASDLVCGRAEGAQRLHERCTYHIFCNKSIHNTNNIQFMGNYISCKQAEHRLLAKYYFLAACH